MIKLNNKNITYVALADSNNSLKAPKEIWYADSSNSVKLVYMRKDALIEGEDYEVHQWLNGDGSAYIDTNIKPSENLRTKIKFAYNDSSDSIARNSSIFGSGLIASGGVLSNRYWVNCDTYQALSYLEIGYGAYHQIGTSIDPTQNTEIDFNYIEANTHKFKINDTVYTQSGEPNTTQNIVIFGRNVSGTIYVSNSKVSYFQLIDSSSLIIDLIPCKLLKPVPKWLDANGIRRQVGECGMIDLVSGKFYGNVNSNGTFTVENYYERKEWLQGRNGAYIDTMHPLTAIDDAMRVHAHYDGVTRNPAGYEQAICGVVEDKNDTDKLWAYIYIGTDNNLNAYQRGIYRYSWYGLQTDSVNSLEFIASISNDGNNFTFTKNSNSITESSPITRKTYGNVYLFNRNTMAQPELVSQRYFQGDIASFQIGNSTFTELSVDMIPCTLTMDLPASMDANNIARTKGTSGMWDLVSDRFYGNVASSGTFKAVNLAEGVDYEVHQWLKAEIPIAVTMITLSIESQNFNWKVKIEQLGNTSYFRSDDYLYFTSTYTTKIVHIWDIPNAEIIFSAQTTKTDGMIVDISSTSDLLTFNGEIIPKYGFQNVVCMIRNANNGVRDAITYTSSITVDGIERYIPVKLLKSIPAKYDANGIARQAGECGMYDTVNDVFYGNVASSGTFSVSDDS